MALLDFRLMHILMVANWWYRRGGLGRVMIDEAEQLEAAGHSVVPYAAAHPENLPTPWSSYFPPFIETAELGSEMALTARAANAARLVYNRDAARRLETLLSEVQPDLLHVHNTVRQLSPSILAVARRRHIPVVMTLHDYGLVCPQGQMYKGEQEACLPPNCLRGNTIHALTNRCIKRSVVGSAFSAIEHLIHRSLRLYLDKVDLFLAPSRFLQELMIGAGVPRAKLRLLPNGLSDVPPSRPLNDGIHVLFTGRLSREKGLDVLGEAARLTPEVPYVVAGDGPMRGDFESTKPQNVRLVGHQTEDELHRLRSQAVAVIVPSTWFENAPMAVLEGMRAARAIIASDIGGHPELLSSGGGQLVPPGDVEALAAAIRAMWNDRGLASRVGEQGRQSFALAYRLETHMKTLLELYGEVAQS